MESNAKGQIAKGNEMVSFKIGDQVLYSLSHGSNRKDSKQYGPSVISQICGGDMYLLAGLKRKYHSNQLQEVNMITSQVNKVCAFLCWYTSSNLFVFLCLQEMEYATCSSRTSTCAATTAITQNRSKQNEELVETKSAKPLLIMPTVMARTLHEQRQKSDTFNGHAALIKNITKFGLQVCLNVPLDGNCLFTAVCDQLMRVLGERKRTKRSC